MTVTKTVNRNGSVTEEVRTWTMPPGTSPVDASAGAAAVVAPGGAGSAAGDDGNPPLVVYPPQPHHHQQQQAHAGAGGGNDVFVDDDRAVGSVRGRGVLKKRVIVVAAVAAVMALALALGLGLGLKGSGGREGGTDEVSRGDVTGVADMVEDGDCRPDETMMGEGSSGGGVICPPVKGGGTFGLCYEEYNSKADEFLACEAWVSFAREGGGGGGEV